MLHGGRHEPAVGDEQRGGVARGESLQPVTMRKPVHPTDDRDIRGFERSGKDRVRPGRLRDSDIDLHGLWRSGQAVPCPPHEIRAADAHGTHVVDDRT